MSISEHKILSADLLNKQVTDAADRPTGTAQQIKYLFDRLALEVVIPALNALIDELTNSGAASVGTSISGVAGTDVQTVLEGLKALIDDRYTKEQADGLLSDKVSKAEFASVLADMSIDENGVITVTRKNGTTKQWDTALEKIAINFDFDAETQKLKLTLEDGTTKEVDLSAFVKPNEFVDSSCIDFITVYTDGTVTATIKAGSVTDEMLDSALKEALIAYRDAAASSAAAAAASRYNALTYMQAAETARTGAEKAQTEAEVSEINAEVYAMGGTPVGHEGEIVLQEELPGAKGYMEQAKEAANSAAASASAADTRANAAAASAVEANSAKYDAAQSEENAKAWAKGGMVTNKKVTSDGTIMYVSEDVTGASEYSSRAYAAYKNAAKYEQYAKAYAEGGTIEEEMVPSVNPLPDVLWPALDTPGAKGYAEQAASSASEAARVLAEWLSNTGLYVVDGKLCVEYEEA